MLRDITIGQHFPGNSVVHRCDPRLKIIATIAYIIVLFMASNPLGIALSLALLALLYKVAQIPIKLIVKSLSRSFPLCCSPRYSTCSSSPARANRWYTFALSTSTARV